MLNSHLPKQYVALRHLRLKVRHHLRLRLTCARNWVARWAASPSSATRPRAHTCGAVASKQDGRADAAQGRHVCS